MKTGFDLLETADKFDDNQKDFLRKAVAIMKVLIKEAIGTADKFVHVCGRKNICANDMYYALMYEAHEFLRKILIRRFLKNLNPKTNILTIQKNQVMKKPTIEIQMKLLRKNPRKKSKKMNPILSIVKWKV